MKTTDNEKYIGLVKWFRDQSRDANYGFIEHPKLGDLFFHERSIEQGQDIKYIRENAIVVFKTRESKKHKDKIEATNVNNLDTETDLSFLFNYYLSNLKENAQQSAANNIQREVHKKVTSLLENTKYREVIEQLSASYLNFIKEILNTESKSNVEYLKRLLTSCQSFFPSYHKQIAELIEKSISVELAQKLWLDGFLHTCQIDYIADTILPASQETKQAIFCKCSEENKSNIFNKMLYNFTKNGKIPQLKSIKVFLDLLIEYAPEQYKKNLTSIINVCTNYYKLNLWLDNYYDTLDFNIYKKYICSLSPLDQRRFVKKVFKYIHEGKANVSVNDLNSLNVIADSACNFVEYNYRPNLDFSTSIILNVISELKNSNYHEIENKTNAAKNNIFDLIVKQIRDPKDILLITGYFDECGGRCSVSVHEEKNTEGVVVNRRISYNRNEHNKAKNHPICDGRKAINPNTKEPVLSDEKVGYWWCANQKCFKPSRELHTSTEWEKYTLLDFLTILKVNFNETDLEIYLNVINKANRFLEHLKCKECNHILYPKGKANYAFYGVNLFICNNPTCFKKGKEIYISHCLNGYCEMVIDSRECVKCKPPDLDSDSCGWYICNNCHACCSEQHLKKRKWVFDNILHKDYNCHLIGHKELGIISCNKCGSSMISNTPNSAEYQRILNWFIENKDNKNHIHKSGKNRNNRWWFLIKRGTRSYEDFRQKLTKYAEIGFHIPDYEIDKDFQLISEPIHHLAHTNHLFICSSCGNTLNLLSDPEKAAAIKKYNTIIFPKVSNNL